MTKSEIQEKFKRVRDSRRELEAIKERYNTYSHIYGAGDSKLKVVNKSLKDKQNGLMSEIEEVQNMIDKLSNISERCTLSLYYIDCLPMSEVAERLFYTERAVWGKHKSALTKLSKLDT